MSYFNFSWVKKQQRYQRSKLMIEKKSSSSAKHTMCVSVESGQVSNFFLILQLWSLIFLGRQIMFILISEKHFCTLLADNKLQHIIWKDLIHTCLETKNQCHGITFDVSYVGSKYHFFISYRGLFFEQDLSFIILKKIFVS